MNKSLDSFKSFKNYYICPLFYEKHKTITRNKSIHYDSEIKL